LDALALARAIGSECSPQRVPAALQVRESSCQNNGFM